MCVPKPTPPGPAHGVPAVKKQGPAFSTFGKGNPTPVRKPKPKGGVQ